MKKSIKFTAQNKAEFIKELREKVNNYFESNKISKYGNFNLAIKTIFMLVLYLTPYFLMLFGIIESLGVALLLWVVIGLGQAGVGMGIMHDSIHRSFSKNQTINKIFGATMYLVGGFPSNWEYQHNTLHHGFTNIDGYDEDIDPGKIIRLSPHKPLLKAHKYQHIYAWFLYTLMTFSWVTTKDFKQLLRYKNMGVPLSGKRTYSQQMAILIISKVIYYGIFMFIPMFLFPFAWYWAFVFFMLMHLTSGFILTVVFQTAHVVPTSEYPMPDENDTIENNWAVHQLLTTSDFAPKNPILSWFIGGLNYQVEHHLFPNISHVHYPRISKFVKEVTQKYNLPYHVQPGFIRAVYEHGKMLKRLGRA